MTKWAGRTPAADAAHQGREDGEPEISEPGGCFLGVDIGSVALSYAMMSPDGRIVAQRLSIHQGDIARLLRETLSALDLSQVRQVAYSQRSGDFFAAG